MGILGLPYALRLSGWFGLTILLGQGFIMRYTAGLLGKCQYRYSLDSYPDIVEVIICLQVSTKKSCNAFRVRLPMVPREELLSLSFSTFSCYLKSPFL